MTTMPEAVKQRLAEVGLTMNLTCSAAPEQYELFRGDEPSGYVRIRRSHFTVDYPDAGGENLYDGTADGYGGFTDHEREGCLLLAINLITQRMAER